MKAAIKYCLYGTVILLNICTISLVADCGSIDPQPHESLFGLTTRIGTEVDFVSSRLCLVESVVDLIDVDVSGVDSSVSLLGTLLCSKIENLDGELSVHDVLVRSQLDVIETDVNMVDTDLSIHDNLICSKLIVIDSKIDALDLAINTSLSTDEILSAIEQVDTDLSIHDVSICSKIEHVDEELTIIDSKVDLVCSKVQVVEANLEVLTASSLDAIADTMRELASISDELMDTMTLIASYSDLVVGELSSLDGMLMAVADQVSVLDVDLSIHDVNICSKIENLDSDLSIHDELVRSQLDVIETDVNTVDTDLSIHDQLICSKLDIIDSKVDSVAECCPCDFFITQTDIPYTITQPGVYCLAENVTFNTGNAITITTSYVTLDLQRHVIDGQDSGTSCITIDSADDVSVYDGLVKNITFGCLITASHKVKIRNVNIDNCSLNGLQIGQASSDIMIEDCAAYNCSSSGFSISITSNCTLRNCIANNTGVGFTTNPLSFNITFLNCQAQEDNTGFNISSDDNLLSDCLAAGNSADGFQLNSQANKTIVRSCNAQNNTGYGFNVSSSSNTEMRGCSSVGNSSSGFSSSGAEQIIMRECDALYNTQSGFDIVSTNSCEIRDCSSVSNITVGFRIVASASSSNITLDNCHAQSNGSHGFLFDGSLSVLFGVQLINCLTEGNGGDGVNVDTVSKMQIVTSRALFNVGTGFIVASSSGIGFFNNLANENTAGNYSGIPSFALASAIDVLNSGFYWVNIMGSTI